LFQLSKDPGTCLEVQVPRKRQHSAVGPDWRRGEAARRSRKFRDRRGRRVS